jgi:hypothetical protein
MAEPIAAPPGYTAALVFDDPTPNAIILNRINRRAVEIVGSYTDLNHEECNDFLDLVMLISRKMVSVWKHLQAYHAEERRLRELFADPGAKHHVYSQELFEEFDVFAVQIKSTLDHVVKVMRPMLGRKWTMYTFAGKGEGVLASLKNNTPRKHAGRVKSMEHFLFSEKHMGWHQATATRERDGRNGGPVQESRRVLRRPPRLRPALCRNARRGRCNETALGGSEPVRNTNPARRAFRSSAASKAEDDEQQIGLHTLRTPTPAC